MAIRKGNNWANTILGTSGKDEIYGFGGNDRLWGGAGEDWLHAGMGNDRLWGQAGPDHLFGGSGKDLLTWNPGRISVNDHVGDPLGTLDGGTGRDTLRIVNNTTVTTTVFDPETGEVSQRTVPSGTLIYLDDEIPAFNGEHRTVMMGDPSWETEGVTAIGATLSGIERIEVSGNGPLTYHNATDMALTVLGTRFHDSFIGGSGAETLQGRDGGDTYASGLGDDTIISARTGSDTFRYEAWGTDHDRILGWNTGDVLEFFGFTGEGTPVLDVAEHARRTVFSWHDDNGGAHSVTVDAVGLTAGRDYLFT
ncbi:calcium-binding protein [Arenibaculum pallidiluteum]|uniref:hypothetical protein n=1 Tax=Arenibaculum pallidiluteum TaxID=2812559 RepID=UPI001A9648FF|nr:hypothetical protein [Arenibaculum pallidiluteum]